MILDCQTFNTDAALAKIDNDWELYYQILDIYLRDAPVLVSDLETRLLTGDLPGACLRAHSLKSTSRIVGAFRLGMLAESIENQIEHSIAFNIGESVPLIKNEFESVKNHILSVIV